MADRLTGIFRNLVEETDGEEIDIGEMVSAIEHRSYGPLLLVPALIAIAPTGAIPGMSIVIGSVIFLISGQMLFMQSRPWLPRRVEKFSFPRGRLKDAIERVSPYLERVERFVRPRISWLANTPFTSIIALMCMGAAVSMYPLALLPFAVAVPGIAIALFGVALTMNDGVFVLAGTVFLAIAVWLAVAFV